MVAGRLTNRRRHCSRHGFLTAAAAPFLAAGARLPTALSSARAPVRRLIAWRTQMALGQRFERLRVVDDPPTEGQRFLLAGGLGKLAAGEDVRNLTRARAEELRLPAFDFWLLDSRLMLTFHADDADETLGIEFIDDPAAVLMACQVRDRARPCSVVALGGRYAEHPSASGPPSEPVAGGSPPARWHLAPAASVSGPDRRGGFRTSQSPACRSPARRRPRDAEGRPGRSDPLGRRSRHPLRQDVGSRENWPKLMRGAARAFAGITPARRPCLPETTTALRLNPHRGPRLKAGKMPDGDLPHRQTWLSEPRSRGRERHRAPARRFSAGFTGGDAAAADPCEGRSPAQPPAPPTS
ncbi:DUF6879 family protein [Streptomyces sp. NPDC059373]